MALRETSFRRIMLFTLLVITLPVLVTGVWMTYRKARVAFLETARQSLTESSLRNAENINQLISALQTNLVTASDSLVLKSGLPKQQKEFLEQIASRQPTHIRCIKLTDLPSQRVVASTCGDQVIDKIDTSQWQKKQQQLVTNVDNIYIKTIIPNKQNNESVGKNQLELLLVAPVYNKEGQLQYTLTFKTALLQQENLKPGSLIGYPVVINEDGIILAHRYPGKIGDDIKDTPDAQRLKKLMANAIQGENNSLYLFFLEKNGVELVAGYTAIDSPVTGESSQKWIILAVSPIESALSELQEIKQVLLVMTMMLMIAYVLAVICVAYILGRPIVQLRDYSQSIKKDISSIVPIRQNFRIREFKQLSESLNQMVEKLKNGAQELENACQEAEQANKLKDDFLTTISHELRNPLNKIITPIVLIQQDLCDSPEEEKEYVQIIHKESVHLLNMIDQILDVSKIVQGKLSVILKPVDLVITINEVIRSVRPLIQKKGLTIQTPKLQSKIIINADPQKLKQVFDNIIGNAVKFTDSGSITINVSIDNQESPPEYELSDENNAQEKSNFTTKLSNQKVIVTVSDTGIGIASNQQKKLFRPFVMADGSSTRKYGGTGLGLSISKSLIQLMEGEVNLFSAGEGFGSTVTIIFPVLAFIPEISPDNYSYSNGNGNKP